MKREQTAQEIGDVFDVNEKSVRRWCAEGCPHSRRKGKLFLNDGETQNWLKKNNRVPAPGRPRKSEKPAPIPDELGGDKDYWLARKYRNQCLQDEGKLVDREAHESAWVGRVNSAKSKLLGLSPQIAPGLVGLDAPDIERLIRDRIEQIIRELSAGE